MLLAGEKRLLEMVARGDSLPLILDALCRLVEELSSGALASILLLDGTQLRHGAAPSLPQAYIDAIDGSVIGPLAGSCGTAAYRGQPVIVSDIATDPLWAEHRGFALPHGLRACWSTPILSSEARVLGTFAIYYREPRTPTPEQLESIEQITHLASIALERKRAEGALQASEQVARGQVEALVQSLDILATAPPPEKFIGQMLSTIGRLLNAQGVILWLLDEPTEELVMRAAVHGDNLAAVGPEHPFLKDPLSWKDNAGLQEMVFTGGPGVGGADDKDALHHLQSARALARAGLNEARRSVRALRPQALEDATFWEALQTVIKSATAGTDLHAEFQRRGKTRELSPLVQENLLHIGQEALTNTLKYAHATRFEARLSFNATEVRLELQDNGVGFKINGNHDGFGLTGMQERVTQMGGAMR